MALVAPPLSVSIHHQPSINTDGLIKKRLSTSKFRTKSSLSLHAQIFQSESPSTSADKFLLLQPTIHLYQSKNLTESFNLLQENSNNVYGSNDFSSAQRKEAIGILLEACGKHKEIEIGRKIHELVSKSTQLSNDFVLNTRLISMYSMCGSPSDSRSVFDDLKNKNLFQWNAIVSAYTRNELFEDTLKIFVEMVSNSEFNPDNFTLPCVIKSCAGILDVDLGKAVHGMAVKMGLVMDVFVGNALVAMYGKFGCVDDALKLFDKMPQRNVVSWNSMISVLSDNGLVMEGFELFREMMECEEGVKPDVATMVILIPMCSVEGDAEKGLMIHGLAVKLGLDQESMVNNALIDMYLKCGFLSEAEILFGRTNRDNVVSCNTMIRGLSTQGYIAGTFDLLREMASKEQKMKINDVTVLNALPACVEKSELLQLKELHCYSVRHGFKYNELIANGLISAYAKCGSFRSAELVFDSLCTKTVSSWNALISGYAQNGEPRKALTLFVKMVSSGLKPDWFTLGSLLLACADLKSLHQGKEIHGYLLRNGLERDLSIAISLLSFYFDCGKSASAQILFNMIEDKSLVSWNAMISGYLQNKLANEALVLFRQMISSGIHPCRIAIASVMEACSQLSASRLGKEAHCYSLKTRIMDGVFISCSVIDMYAKTGFQEQSRRIFDRLREKGVASWNAVMGGYGIHGHGEEAMELFEKMQSFGLKPDSITFIGILMACSHSGMVEEGLKYFDLMRNYHKMEPKLEHYACIVDMLGRAGRLDEAYELINAMPEEPDTRIWSSLLSSCRTHGALDLGEEVAEELLDLEPNKPENYILLSNLYAGAGKWNDVRRTRQRMKDVGLQKESACSWIEIQGKVHSFVVGDRPVPGLEDIYDM